MNAKTIQTMDLTNKLMQFVLLHRTFYFSSVQLFYSWSEKENRVKQSVDPSNQPDRRHNERNQTVSTVKHMRERGT